MANGLPLKARNGNGYEAHSSIASSSGCGDRESDPGAGPIWTAAGTAIWTTAGTKRPATTTGTGRSIRARPGRGSHQRVEWRSFGSSRRLWRRGGGCDQWSLDGQRQYSYQLILSRGNTTGLGQPASGGSELRSSVYRPGHQRLSDPGCRWNRDVPDSASQPGAGGIGHSERTNPSALAATLSHQRSRGRNFGNFRAQWRSGDLQPARQRALSRWPDHVRARPGIGPRISGSWRHRARYMGPVEQRARSISAAFTQL